MVKRRIKQIKLGEVFSDWRKVEEGDKGFVLVVLKNNRLMIIKAVEIKDFKKRQKIFLGELKKSTLGVGFLNALFQNEDFLEEIDFNNLQNILIPILSKLRVGRINQYLQTLEKTERRVLMLKKALKVQISSLII